MTLHTNLDAGPQWYNLHNENIISANYRDLLNGLKKKAEVLLLLSGFELEHKDF